jgi:hypothetical protein
MTCNFCNHKYAKKEHESKGREVRLESKPIGSFPDGVSQLVQQPDGSWKETSWYAKIPNKCEC